MYLIEDVRMASPSQLEAHTARKKLRMDIARDAVEKTAVATPEPVCVPPIIESKAPIEEKPAEIQEPEKIDFPTYIQGNAKTLVKLICKVCANEFNVDTSDILSRRRHAQIIVARHAAFGIAKYITRWSLPEIGRRFGGRDHTTILHGLRKVERLMNANPGYAETIKRLREQVIDHMQAKAALSGECERGLPEQQGEGTGENTVS